MLSSWRQVVMKAILLKQPIEKRWIFDTKLHKKIKLTLIDKDAFHMFKQCIYLLTNFQPKLMLSAKEGPLKPVQCGMSIDCTRFHHTISMVFWKVLCKYSWAEHEEYLIHNKLLVQNINKSLLKTENMCNSRHSFLAICSFYSFIVSNRRCHIFWHAVLLGSWIALPKSAFFCYYAYIQRPKCGYRYYIFLCYLDSVQCLLDSSSSRTNLYRWNENICSALNGFAYLVHNQTNILSSSVCATALCFHAFK